MKETRWAEAKAATSYMVRALRLETGPWGSYVNASQGARID